MAKPDARIALTTSVVGHMREFNHVFREVLADRPDYLARLAVQKAHRGTRESHIQVVKQAGFHIARLLESEFSLRYLDGGAMLRHSFVRMAFLSGWRSVVDPADEQTVFAELEQRLNARAARQGELRMTIPMLYVEGMRPTKKPVTATRVPLIVR